MILIRQRVLSELCDHRMAHASIELSGYLHDEIQV